MLLSGMRSSPLLATSLCLLGSPSVGAQSFETRWGAAGTFGLGPVPQGSGVVAAVSAWTGDATSGITSNDTWAYHFGSATGTFINGRSVPGLTGAAPSVPGQFAVTGVTQVFNNDSNSLTSQTGTFDYLDAQAASETNRFYRLRWRP